MTGGLNDAVLVSFLIFCRIGSCFMLAPAFSSPRIPMGMRLLLAVAVSMALTPLLRGLVWPALASSDGLPLVPVLNELAVGAVLGLTARCFLLAAQFAAVLSANAIGLVGVPGIPIEEGEALIPLASLASLAAAMMLVASDLHLQVLKSLVDSYAVFSPAGSVDPAWPARVLTDTLASTSLLGLRLAAPLLTYAVTVNVALGLASRFAPKLQIYFVSTGGVMIGGLIVLAAVAPEWMAYVSSASAAWLRDGIL